MWQNIMVDKCNEKNSRNSNNAVALLYEWEKQWQLQRRKKNTSTMIVDSGNS